VTKWLRSVALPHRHTAPQVATECIFCGASNLTKEHIFPRWSHRYMLPRQKGRAVSLSGSVYLDRKETVVGKLPGQLRDWQIRCVCGGTHLTCNGGWMKDIEDRVKPLLVPLILGHTVRLRPDDQSLIATWAVLKVMVSEFWRSGQVTTHWTQRRRMLNRQEPPESGWGVWIAHYERINWKPEWISHPFFVPSETTLARKGLQVPTRYNGSAVTQVIGKVFIQVIHSPEPDDFISKWRFSGLRQGILFRVWPVTSFSIRWPLRAISDREADEIADAIPQFLLRVARQVAARRQTP
jgi:hypothetical protein